MSLKSPWLSLVVSRGAFLFPFVVVSCSLLINTDELVDQAAQTSGGRGADQTDASSGFGGYAGSQVTAGAGNGGAGGAGANGGADAGGSTNLGGSTNAGGDSNVSGSGAGGNKACTVLILSDEFTGNDAKFDVALRSLNITPTLIVNGTATYQGAPSAEQFSTVYVTPGTTLNVDMPEAGQSAILNAVNQGTGFVVTEWFNASIAEARYKTLAPLQLIERKSGTSGTSTITPTVPLHPIWYGLSEFTTTVLMSWNRGNALLNQGESLGTCQLCDFGPAVAIRDKTAGRVVQLAHAANYKDSLWSDDLNLLKLAINAVAWAGHCAIP
jgi:hypothetical protein